MEFSIQNLRYDEKIVSSLLKTLTGIEEVEFRFGSIVHDSVSSKPKFEPGVSKYLFDGLLNQLISSRQPYQVFDDTVFFYDTNIRKIVEKERTIFQRKIRLQDIRISAGEFDSRLSISREDMLTESDIQLPTQQDTTTTKLFQRRRSRYRFSFSLFYLDFTVVYGGEKVSYEIEIELNHKPKSVKELFDPYMECLHLLSPLYHEIADMITDFNSLFPLSSRPSDMFQIVSYDNHPKNLKPIDIQLRKYTFFRTYSVTNKLNGVGYFLITARRGIYLVNSTDYMKLSSECPKEHQYSILQGEWFMVPNGERQFHVFDCIRLKGKDVTKQPHLLRSKYIDLLLNDKTSPDGTSIQTEGLYRVIKRTDPTISIFRKKFFFSGRIEKRVLQVPSDEIISTAFGKESSQEKTEYIVVGELTAHDIQQCLQWMKETYQSDMEKANDGLIFTSTDFPYMDRPILKYKFPHTMTIDFLLKDGDLTSSPQTHTFHLYVYDKQSVVPFIGGGGGDPNQPSPPSILTIHHDHPLFSSLTDGMIVECSYRNQSFFPERIRYDKTKPNFIDVAKDVFDDMIHPMTVDDLVRLVEQSVTSPPPSEQQLSEYNSNRKISFPPPFLLLPHQESTPPSSSGGADEEEKGTPCMVAMKKYHGFEKRRLISMYYPHRIGMSIGFGRGGDIFKYRQAQANMVIGIEPNDENIREAKSRIDTNMSRLLPTRFILIHEKAQQNMSISSQIKPHVPSEQVDVVDSFFSLTFFFESQEELDRLCNTISGHLKYGGHFIGTTMDGEKVVQYMKGKDSIQIPGCFSIQKHYSDTDFSSSVFGKKISIHLTNSIVDHQDEYLVSFPHLESTLKRWGLVLVDTGFFSPSSETVMGKDVADFSRLNRWFVFQRKESDTEQKTRERASQEKQKETHLRQYMVRLLSPGGTEPIEPHHLGIPLSLVRVGTIPDGNCFFHALLNGLDSTYSSMSKNQKKQYINHVRHIVSERLTRPDWELLGNGQLAIQQTMIYFSKLLSCDDSLSSLYLPLLTIPIQAKNVFEWRQLLLRKEKETIPSHPSSSSSPSPSLSFLLSHSEDIAYQMYKRLFCTDKEWVSHDMIEWISNVFGINVYILQDKTRLPYFEPYSCLNPSRNSVLIFWISENHYEGIRVIEEDSTSLSVFPPSHRLIQRLRDLQCHSSS